ncbi:ATP-binding protein [Caldimonas brevitalea]|uniref:histidine kinase n=1 Tax=Caldimonas brevitalea TaxID=413882 RepID=A0A0G3BZV5_9BURK|nr:ATP-binding protein [Caldimonas brevitalea]AKJ32070.1 two-component system, OmpR family, sensor histidine kinase TctE [Caldimonas brevitalea]
MRRSWCTRRFRTASLRSFLLVGLLGGLWLIVALMTAALYVHTSLQLAEAQDRRLQAALSRVPLAGLPAPAGLQPPTYHRVSTMNGDWLAGEPGLAAFPWRDTLSPAGVPQLYFGHLGGTLVRVAAAARHVPGEAGETLRLVQAAEPVSRRWAGWRDLPLNTLAWLYTLAGAMSLLVIGCVAIALRWLARARVALGGGQHDEPRDYDGPSELRPAVERMQQLHRRQREWVDQQRRFLADASHQLRTPMSVLRTQLQSAIAGDAPAAEVLPQMLHTVDRAAGLVHQLLSLTKLEQIKRAGELQAVDLRLAARDAVMELSPLIAAKRLDFALEGEPCQAPADAVMLGELVRNLLANAIHHTPPNGRLGIVLRAYGPRVELVVWDEGPGVDDQVRPRLFQPFSAAKGGVGLGLSICRQIADAMGASMNLYNRVEDDKVIGVDAVVAWGQGP